MYVQYWLKNEMKLYDVNVIARLFCIMFLKPCDFINLLNLVSISIAYYQYKTMPSKLTKAHGGACTLSLKYIKIAGLPITRTSLSLSSTLIFPNFRHNLTPYKHIVPENNNQKFYIHNRKLV